MSKMQKKAMITIVETWPFKGLAWSRQGTDGESLLFWENEIDTTAQGREQWPLSWAEGGYL